MHQLTNLIHPLSLAFVTSDSYNILMYFMYLMYFRFMTSIHSTAPSNENACFQDNILYKRGNKNRFQIEGECQSPKEK